MTAPLCRVSLAQTEALTLADLASQFVEICEQNDADDPALVRLSPDAYADDPVAATEFRRLTQTDQSQRRITDASTMIDTLEVVTEDTDPMRMIDIDLNPDEVNAWMRTLAALRLVVATRLEIGKHDDHDDEDPRFGMYDWLGYRLESLIESSDQ